MKSISFILVFLVVLWLIAPTLSAADEGEPAPGDDGQGNDGKAEKEDPPDDKGDADEGDDQGTDDGNDGNDDTDDSVRDNPPIPSVEIKRININVYPHLIVLIKGQLVDWEKIRKHLDELVEDARKDAVEVTLIPFSKEEMTAVAEIIKIAKDVGYTRVNFISAKPKKKEITEIIILILRSGTMIVNESLVQPDALKGHLEKTVEPERREKVGVFVLAGSQVPRKNVATVVKTAREVGFKDVQFGPMGD